MSRKFKNLITLILIILLGTSFYFTLNFAKDSIESSNQNMIQNNSKPPSEASISKNNSETPPEKPAGDNKSEAPPEMPSGGNTNEVPSGMPNEENNNMMAPDANVASINESSNNLSIIFYVLFAIESLGISSIIIYLIMSNLNKKLIKETFKNSNKIIIFILSVIILTSALTILNLYITKNVLISSGESNKILNNGNMGSNNNMSASATASNEIDGKEETLKETYESNDSDKSVILVKNSGELTLENAIINKNSGDSSNTENS